MALKSVVMEFGTGIDLRGADDTKAAVRAVEAAVRRHAITFAEAFGVPREDQVIEVVIGVPRPDRVDRGAVARALPYGNVSVDVVAGGMAIPHEDGADTTIMANAVVTVLLDLGEDAA